MVTKLKFTIFVPMSACGCNYGKFMDRLFKITLPYRDLLDAEMKDAAGPEGEKWQISQNTILIEQMENEPKKFVNLSDFERFLRTYFAF